MLKHCRCSLHAVLSMTDHLQDSLCVRPQHFSAPVNDLKGRLCMLQRKSHDIVYTIIHTSTFILQALALAGLCINSTWHCGSSIAMPLQDACAPVSLSVRMQGRFSLNASSDVLQLSHATLHALYSVLEALLLDSAAQGLHEATRQQLAMSCVN